MKRFKNKLALIALTIGFMFSVFACTDGNNGDVNKEAESRDRGYAAQVAQQPAFTMTYSPTRQTINVWRETWNKRGQVAFVYILNQDAQKIGYFVFTGPPVSYCATLTPTYEGYDFDGDGDDDEDTIVPAPSGDGVYYSGGQCIQYYGVDATTGQLLEFTVGGTLNYLMSTQPLDLSVPPLGYTEVSDLTPNADGEYTVSQG